MLSILFPVRNEAQNIAPLILQLKKVLETRAGLAYEMIFIDDYSSDTTVTILDTISRKDPSIRIIKKQSEKIGVGISFRIGILHSKGENILTMDADFSHNPSDIPKLLDGLTKNIDLVIGSRYVKNSKYHMQSPRKVLSQLFNSFLKHLFQVPISDITSGFRLIRKKRFLALKLTGEKFEIHPEINLKAALSQFQINEVPIVFVQRRRGKSKLKYLQMLSRYFRLIFSILIRKKEMRKNF